MTDRYAKSVVRKWLIKGGAGHEDGEDGIRAGRVSMERAIEIAAEFYRYMETKPTPLKSITRSAR